MIFLGKERAAEIADRNMKACEDHQHEYDVAETIRNNILALPRTLIAVAVLYIVTWDNVYYAGPDCDMPGCAVMHYPRVVGRDPRKKEFDSIEKIVKYFIEHSQPGEIDNFKIEVVDGTDKKIREIK